MAEIRRDADTDEHKSFRIASASYGVRSIAETDRLKLARQLLLSLGVLTVGFFTWYAMAPANTALQAIFELFKIGVLPLVTLIVSFYFSRTDQ